MKTQTFLIRCEYPDGDHIPTQEFVENIQEYFAANIMDGERGRLVVKPVYQPKRDSLYQECLDAVPEEIKEMVSLEVEFSNFISLVKRMREAQSDFEIIDMSYEYAKDHRCADRELVLQRVEAMTKVIKLEDEVDEYLKEMESIDRRKALEAENTEFDYGHNVKHYSED